MKSNLKLRLTDSLRLHHLQNKIEQVTKYQDSYVKKMLKGLSESGPWIPSRVDIINMYAHVIRSMLRRSKISDSIPDDNANRKIGKVVAVVIRETYKGSGASEVISHDAPTSYIVAPTYEKRAAIHNILYRLDLRGLKPDAEISSLSGSLSAATIGMGKQDLVIHFSK